MRAALAQDRRSASGAGGPAAERAAGPGQVPPRGSRGHSRCGGGPSSARDPGAGGSPGSAAGVTGDTGHTPTAPSPSSPRPPAAPRRRQPPSSRRTPRRSPGPAAALPTPRGSAPPPRHGADPLGHFAEGVAERQVLRTVHIDRRRRRHRARHAGAPALPPDGPRSPRGSSGPGPGGRRRRPEHAGSCSPAAAAPRTGRDWRCRRFIGDPTHVRGADFL